MGLKPMNIKTIYDEDIEKYILNSEEKTEYNYSKGKARLDLVPPILVEAVGEIMTYGIEKYEEGSWRTVEPHRYRAALLRHLMQYLKDPLSIDTESGYLHLWHAACNIAFLLELDGLKGYIEK